MDGVVAKRWLAGHQAAERRALDALREEGPASPEVSFARSMELLDLVPESDPFRDQGVLETRALWTKLKASWSVGRHSR